MLILEWKNLVTLESRAYKCGHCGEALASQHGYRGHTRISPTERVEIYICHHCTRPTFFDTNGNQIPGPILGNPVHHIPNKDVENLFKEAKACFAINAYTSCVMCCRKLLMNIAVAEGAPEGKTFVEYVDHLNQNSYIPPKGKTWVDSIRKLGNEANHSIQFRSEDEATLILTFTEMLLRFIYEMPGMMEENSKQQTT